MNKGALIFITGPTRSGKSTWAEHLARKSGKAVIYIATAQRNPEDAEWEARIQAHQQRRPAHWLLVCAPLDLTEQLVAHDHAQSCLLVDSLGAWVANHLAQNDTQWDQQTHMLFSQLKQAQALRIFVAEETGWGVVPAYPSGRLFRDRLGKLTRQMGAQADEAYLVTAGYVLNLRQLGMPLPEAPE